MKTRLIAAFGVLMLGTAAHAETFEFPSDDPVASVTFPDTWSAEETETGLQAFSPEDSIALYVDVTDAQSVETTVNEAIEFLGGNGVTVDQSTLSESSDTLNGMEMSNLDWSGTDEPGPVSIGLSFVQPSPESLLVITYWGSQEKQAQFSDDLVSIIGSLQPAE